MNKRPSEFGERDPLAYDPLHPVPPAPTVGGRAGLVLLAMVAALFVIGFIAFSGDPAVDRNTTASIPGDPAQEEILPGNAEPIAPNAATIEQEAPAPTE